MNKTTMKFTKTCYLAGPMRGIERFNVDAFNEAKKELEWAGWKVVSPVDLDIQAGLNYDTLKQEDLDMDAIIRRDLHAVMNCDAIFLLPGWEKSKGANAELNVAYWAGKKCHLYPSGEEVRHEKTNVTTESSGGLPDSGARTKFETGAQRDAMEGKGYPSDIPPCAITALAQLYEKGAKKYDRGNWRIGIPLSRYYDAIFRHCMKAGQGLTDEDHLAAVMWNAAGWMWTLNEIQAGRRPAELNDLQYWEGPKVSAPLELQSCLPLPQS